MTQKHAIQWGILGAARIAASYAKAIPQSRNSTVLAVASRDRDKAQVFAEDHGIPRVHGNYEALLADPQLDAVYIALPNALHAEWTLKALAAGKHVLCEKPLAMSAEEGESMRRAAESAGLHLAEGLMYRRHPLNVTALNLLHSGRIGDLVAANATFFAPVGEDDPIRFSVALGGGALLDLGLYCVSLLRWAAGGEPDRIHAVAKRHPQGVDFWSAGALGFPSGAIGTFTCAYGTPFACRYELVGRKGRIVCDGGPLCAWPGGEFAIQIFPESGDPETIEVPPADHYQLMAEEFADVVLGRCGLRWGLDESLANLRVLDALRSGF